MLICATRSNALSQCFIDGVIDRNNSIPRYDGADGADGAIEPEQGNADCQFGTATGIGDPHEYKIKTHR